MKRYHKYMHNKEWQTFRRHLLMKRGYQCQRCHVPTARLELHHKRELFRCKTEDELRSSTYDASNIEILCRSCHIAESKRGYEERKRARRGMATPAAIAWDNLVSQRIKEVQTHDQERTVAT